MIWWVMGGTAVGKKRFIECAVSDPARFGLPAGLASVWYADGETSVDDLVLAAGDNPIIIRWQWGRENALNEIRVRWPGVNHTIILCKAYPSVQRERVVAREGFMKWDEWGLMKEAIDVEAKAQELSMAHRIPVVYVNANSEYETKVLWTPPCESTSLSLASTTDTTPPC